MNDRGSFLVTSLFVVSITALLAASLGNQTSARIILLKAEMGHFEKKADLISGLNLAAYAVAMDTQPYEDSIRDNWYGRITLEEPWRSRFEIQISDEEAKINVNLCTETWLRNFFHDFEEEAGPLEAGKEDWVNAIMKKRGVEKIDSLEIFFLKEGLPAKDWSRLKPYLTTVTETALVNPNTASQLVLRAYLESLPASSAAKQILSGRLKEFFEGKNTKKCIAPTSVISSEARDPGMMEASGFLRASPVEMTTRELEHGIRKNFLTREYLTPSRLESLLGLPANLDMAQAVQAFLSGVTLDSETFLIEIKTAREFRAETLARIKDEQTPPHILSWREI